MSFQGRIAAAAIALAAILGAYWFLALAPKREEIATARDQVAQAQSRRDAALARAATAGEARAAYQRDYANVARLGKAAPADDDVASLVYQLESVARANKIDFRAVKLAAGASAAAPAASTGRESAQPAPGDSAAAGTAPASGAKDATGATATATAKTATAAPAAPAIAQAPPGAVVGSAGLVTLPFNFTFDGGYLPMQRMLGAIDRLAAATDGAISVRGRLLTVDGFALTASRFGFPKVQALVSATAYIVPATEGVTGGATPQGPATGATATPAAPAGAGGSGSPTTTATIQGVR